MTRRTETIVAALGACRTTVRSHAPGQWTLALAGDPAFLVHARIDGAWLVLDGQAARTGFPCDAWSLLEASATLPGGAAFAWSPHAPGLRVRAGIILDDDVDVAARVTEAVAGLSAACVRGARRVDPERQTSLTPAVDLPSLVRQTRWRPTEHDGGPLTIDLDVPGTFAQATTRIDPHLGVVLEAPVADVEYQPRATSTCHQALGTFLLRVTAALRGARAVAPPLDRPRFEAVLGSNPGVADLHHGCAALSVACRLASREAAVLARDEVVAGTYLEHAKTDRRSEQWEELQ